jgi:hypothetical protein
VLEVTGRDVAEGEYGVRLVGGCDWRLGRPNTGPAVISLATPQSANAGAA